MTPRQWRRAVVIVAVVIGVYLVGVCSAYAVRRATSPPTAPASACTNMAEARQAWNNGDTLNCP